MDLEGISPLQAASGDLAAHHPSLQRMHWKAISVADDTWLESCGERPMAICHDMERWFAPSFGLIDQDKFNLMFINKPINPLRSQKG
jgi:hypothetical protein